MINRFWKYIIRKFKAFFKFVKKWSNTISTLAMVFSIIYVVLSTRENLNMVSEALNASNEQLRLQKKSIPAQFVMSYKNINSSTSEQAFITNTGKTNLQKVTTEWEYYFIDNNDNVYLGSNMKRMVQIDADLLEKIVNNNYFNLIRSPSDFDGLFGTGRKFDITYLEAESNNSEMNETLLDISSSSIQNAIKLNTILGTEMFMRWRIKYNEELSNKKMITYKYIWFVNDSSLKDTELRRDLQNVIGGERIIELISNYESNTKDLIFK
jgi:hypothetical protein